MDATQTNIGSHETSSVVWLRASCSMMSSYNGSPSIIRAKTPSALPTLSPVR